MTDREESTTEMQIPRNQTIEIPKTEVLSLAKIAKKTYTRPDYYYRHLTLPTNSLENILDYEYTDDDIPIIQELENNKKVPQGLVNYALFEKMIDVWEVDTGKGQIIPLVRAAYLIKEQKVCEKLDLPENYQISTLIIQTFYDHWIKTREKLGHPLLRRFWRADSVTDTQLRSAFQPRQQNWTKERMRLRNAKKNDNDSFDKVIPTQMKSVHKQWESLHTLAQSIFYREQLKKYSVEIKIAAFEQERCEKIQKKIEIYLPDPKVVDVSKELRCSTKFVDAVVPVMPSIPLTLQPSKIELPVKRVRTEIQKRTDFPVEIALICCKLILEGEKMKVWPLIDPKKGDSNENVKEPSKNVQMKREDKLRMRGRVGRGSKKMEIDRLLISDCEHSWGRYMGLSGNWHRLDGESQNDFFEDEDNEAFQRLHKMITLGFRKPTSIRSH